MTEATLFLPGLSPVGGKTITATFDGGTLSSNGGVLIQPRKVVARVEASEQCSDARIQFVRMPLHLGDHSARLRPACRLVGEIGVVPPDLVRRPSDWAFQQIADPVLKDLIGGQPDRVSRPPGTRRPPAWRRLHRPGNRSARPCPDTAQ